MMVRKHQVHDLQTLCLMAVQDLISERCLHIARIVAEKKTKISSSKRGLWDSSIAGSAFSAETLNFDDKQGSVKRFVNELKEYVWSRVVCYLYEQVVHHILEGVIEAIEALKAEWTIDTNMPDFRMKICAMIKVGEVMHLKQLKALNVDEMPKMIRPSVLQNLSDFCEVRRLDLGSSSGGRKEQMLNTSVLEGLEKMQHLVQFSLKYNCRNDILNTLSNSCRNTLKVLDVEHSNQLTDESIPTLLKFSKLTELGISRTNFTANGQAIIIMEMKELKTLTRGDFLCDALEWIDWEKTKCKKQKFKITNFWASEVYYFHSTEQMEHVSDLCPLIEDMLFMYEDRFTCQVDVLANFKHLKKLEFFGGDFFVDNIGHMLDNIGHGLVKLDLHHVDNIDLRAISVLSTTCQKLKYLGFSGCIFYHPNIDILEDNPENHLFILQEQKLEQELKSKLVPFIDLEVISIANPCPEKLLITLLSLCINVKKINLGISCGITDSTFDNIFPTNKFQYLEEVEIKKNDELTMKTLNNLLLYCDNIRSILDVTEWSKLNKSDLAELIFHMKENNIDLVLQEKSEDMRGVSLYQICQTAQTEKYQSTEWFRLLNTHAED
eukprot:GFUD01013351.1.p1 GENE.GFUD01013351.1~~GFUD01013351.1.p1  ORF type:complete len:606 (+),score=129.36 GFUD01013351.1:29-1846(+)